MKMIENPNRKFWQQLIDKYSERTNELQRKEQDLLLRTQKLQKLIDSNPANEELSLPLSTKPSPPKVQIENSSCKCPPTTEREQQTIQQPTGFFQCLLKVIFPETNQKQLPAPIITINDEQPEQEQQEIVPDKEIAIESEATTTNIKDKNKCTSDECVCIPPITQLSDSSDCICDGDSDGSDKKSEDSLQKRANNSQCDVFSLKSDDLVFMQNLQSLLIEQKNLDRHICELEQKERMYQEFLKEHKNIGDNPQLPTCNCFNKNSTDDNNNNKQLCELKLENLLLKNELNELKLENRLNAERLEGSMQLKIECEHYKCKKLEEQLEQQTKQFIEQQQLYKDELNTLKTELFNKCINELEQKGCSYQEFLKERDNTGDNQQLPNCNCLNTNLDDSKQLCELKFENLLLKNELKELKLEKRLDYERIEGSTQLKTECERYRCKKLEKQLEQQTKQFTEQQQLYKDEINTLRMEIFNANTSLCKLNQLNQELNLNKHQLEKRIQQLEDDLAQQKANQLALEKSNQLTTITQDKKSCNLNEIARELSKTLKEIGSCGECSNIPSDIKTTAEYIKELAILIDNKLPRKSGDLKHSSSSSVKTTQSSAKESQKSADLQQQENVAQKNKCCCKKAIGADKKSEEVIVVMPTNDNIKSQSSKSLNQEEDGVSSPPLQIPPFIKCKCSLSKLINQAPYMNIDNKSLENVEQQQDDQNSPFNVDRHEEILDEPPHGVTLTTTITKSGTLEFQSKGPDGAMETTFKYNKSGTLELTAEMLQVNQSIIKRDALQTDEDREINAIIDECTAEVEKMELNTIEEN